MYVGARSRSSHTAGSIFLFRSTTSSERKRRDLAYVLNLPFPLKSHKKKKKEAISFQEMDF